MTARDRVRWVAPALLAAAMPLASRLVLGFAAEPVAPPVGLAVQMAWAAMPFVALAALAVLTRRRWAQVRLATGVGLALTALAWAWLTWGRARLAAGVPGIGDLVFSLVVLGAPVALLSVMVTAAAVRAAFAPKPGPR